MIKIQKIMYIYKDADVYTYVVAQNKRLICDGDICSQLFWKIPRQLKLL